MSPTLNGSLEILCFERSDAIEICEGIMFVFYSGLPRMCIGILFLFGKVYCSFLCCGVQSSLLQLVASVYADFIDI